MTRDCVLPIVAPLAAAVAGVKDLATLVAELPGRFTAADRIAGIAPEKALDLLGGLSGEAGARAEFFADCDPDLGAEAGLDLTDGLRVRFAGGDIVHLRPSGNAPEFRAYAESDDPERAATLVAHTLARIAVEMAGD
jgi:phosphomannomutase